MNSFLLYGIIIVNVALIGYSIAFIIITTTRKASALFIVSLITALFADITATALMIAGSSNGPVTLHGMFGYSALLFMVFETYSFSRFKVQNKNNETIETKQIQLFSIAFFYWIAAYVTGIIIIMIKNTT